MNTSIQTTVFTKKELKITNLYINKIIKKKMQTKKITKCIFLNLTTFKLIYFNSNVFKKLWIIFSTLDFKFGLYIWPLNLNNSKKIIFLQGYNLFY